MYVWLILKSVFIHSASVVQTAVIAEQAMGQQRAEPAMTSIGAVNSL